MMVNPSFNARGHYNHKLLPLVLASCSESLLRFRLVLVDVGPISRDQRFEFGLKGPRRFSDPLRSRLRDTPVPRDFSKCAELTNYAL